MAQNSTVYGLYVVLVTILMLSIACFSIINAASVLDLNQGKTVQRLREMFEKSQAEAINNFYEQKALKMMANPVDALDSEPARIKFIPMSLLDSHNNTDANQLKGDQMSAKYLVVKQIESSMKKNESSTDEADDNEDSIKAKSNQSDQHGKNDARQSSYFGGLGGPQRFGNTFGSTNPMMGGFLRQPTFAALPAFPTISPFTTRPPRPPKSSIIGNNGGAMALTNDNVVVVNVLSGNY